MVLIIKSVFRNRIPAKAGNRIFRDKKKLVELSKMITSLQKNLKNKTNL